MSDWLSRLAIAAAGLLGAAGIAAAAAASHLGDDHVLGSLALVALTQAPALLALGLQRPPGRLFCFASAFIGLGAILFCVDLAAVHFLDASPLPLAAPAGGLLLIAGWLMLALAALVRRRIP